MAKSILKVNSTKMSNDIDDYLSDDFTDEDLTPPKDDDKKYVNHINGKKTEDDDKYYDDLSYSDDDSLLSQERYENSLKASKEKKKSDKDEHKETDRKMTNSDGPRVMSSEEEIRYFLDPLDEGEKDTPMSAKTLLKTQDVRSLVTNQNKLLDNLGGMKRDIGNLDKEIDLIRSQIRSSAVISGVTSSVKPAPKVSSTSNSSSRRSTSYIPSSSTSTSYIPSSSTSVNLGSTRRVSSKVPNTRSSYAGATGLPIVESSRVRYSVGSAGNPNTVSVLGSAIRSGTLSSGYVPGSYVASKTGTAGYPVTKYTTVPRVSSVPPATGVRYTPVGTVTITTRPRTYTTYRRPVYVDDWDDMDETAIGTYLSSTSRPPHIGTFTNRVFDSLYSTSNLY